MTVVRAIVQGSRIRVDEPTDLPDGTELVLIVEDELEPMLTTEEQAGLVQGLRSIEQGRVVSFEQMERETETLLQTYENRARR
jgi:hypothetical protein